MKLNIMSVLLSLLILLPLAAKGSTDESTGKSPVRVASLTGPSGLSMARMVCDPPRINSVPFQFEIAGSVDVLIPKLVTGDIDIGILPVNVAAKLHATNPQLLVVGAVTGLGMLCVVTRNSAITRIEDLSGKKLYVAGQGATPEYVLRTLLKKAGVDQPLLDFSLSPADIAAALASGKIDYAVLPEPFTTLALARDTETPRLFRAIVLSDAWRTAGFARDFPMTVCVIRRQFAQNNPELVRSFLEAYRQSIEWTVDNPAEAGVCAERSGLALLARVAEQAIPYCGYTFIPASEARPIIDSLLSVFLDYAPSSIGGKLPDGSFYFK